MQTKSTKKAAIRGESSFPSKYITGEQISQMKDWELFDLLDGPRCEAQIMAVVELRVRYKRGHGARVL